MVSSASELLTGSFRASALDRLLRVNYTLFHMCWAKVTQNDNLSVHLVGCWLKISLASSRPLFLFNYTIKYFVSCLCATL